jgi:hypothetical protein
MFHCEIDLYTSYLRPNLPLASTTSVGYNAPESQYTRRYKRILYYSRHAKLQL